MIKSAVVSFSELSRMGTNMSAALYVSKAYQDLRGLSSVELHAKAKEILENAPEYSKDQVKKFLNSSAGKQEQGAGKFGINTNRAMGETTRKKVVKAIETGTLPTIGDDKNIIFVAVHGLLNSVSKNKERVEDAKETQKILLQELKKIEDFLGQVEEDQEIGTSPKP